ncbi:MAG: adenosylmethionine decarboxylase [Alphaproteobacteria bacterium]
MDQTSPLSENIAVTKELASLMETPVNDNAPKDYFTERDGELFAGAHVLADLWGAKRLDDIEYMEEAMRNAVEACGATLLHIHLHHFGEGCGVSGVAVLAESHISVHTWPERGFAAFDIFMCGACEPELALPVLQKYFNPERMDTELQKRGKIA